MHDKIILGLPHSSKIPRRAMCQACGKAIPMRTVTVYFKETYWTPDMIEANQRHLPNAIAWTTLSGPPGDPVSLGIWMGEYNAYGRDDEEVPLVCKQPCAISFASVLYRAGKRLTFHGELLDRPWLQEPRKEGD